MSSQAKSLSRQILFFLLAASIVLFFGSRIILPVNAETLQSDTVFSDIYEEVSPSVVAINVIAERQGNSPSPIDQTVAGSGTGFILDNEGHILTNNHVVDGAVDIEVSFTDGTLARATVVGLDPDSDLAVLQVDLAESALAQLQPVEFADSNALTIGQTVLAIGGPFGQRWTLTSGIISALDRNIRSLTDFSISGVIQTDAAINPGNSGGPLLDLDGRVIGVNSQILSSTNSNSGIGFAIPSNLAQRVTQDLIEKGFVNYSYLGISGGNVSLSLIEAFNMKNNTQGVVIADVTSGGPAARAGIKSAVFSDSANMNDYRTVPTSVDIITAIDGKSLKSINDLISYLAANTEPGQTVSLDVLRNGTETLQVNVVLSPRP
jgi:S1-C subfamily serine protease